MNRIHKTLTQKAFKGSQQPTSMKRHALFPYDQVRPVQDEFMERISQCIKTGISIIAHAPTGLGKTAASLSPALAYSLEHDKVVFFLTSRQTQHRIAIETLQEIKKHKKSPLIACDIIGKQSICPQKGVGTLRPNEFNDYCKQVHEDRTCEYYTTIWKKGALSAIAKRMIEHIKNDGPFHAEEVKEMCIQDRLCPYDILLQVASSAQVVVADYYYMFNHYISDIFLKKIGRQLEDCILIIDEGHNLGNRVRNLMTVQLSTFMVERALKESTKYSLDSVHPFLLHLKKVIDQLSEGMRITDERNVAIGEFIKAVGEQEYDEIIDECLTAGGFVQKEQKRSAIHSISGFLDAWKGEDEGYARILSRKRGNMKPFSVISYRCLDPALITRAIINKAHSTILMSGTLLPTTMYRETLGFPEETVEREFPSPFPPRNRLNMIIPKTTTKYSRRCDDEYKRIAGVCAGISNTVPGNIAFFFPSYSIRDCVLSYFSPLSEKTVFCEMPNISKEEKNGIIEEFKRFKKAGAVLCGVAAGSFGEGIDLPGDFLKAVVVVGLPLQVPDLETKQLIEYYDLKFSKGWEYGYVLPAITKSLQNAGRCIRSETDKGIIIFLDERFSWPNYLKCFPQEWDIQVSIDFQNTIKKFLMRE